MADIFRRVIFSMIAYNGEENKEEKNEIFYI
jgi:hypothetical protein